jgi:hypothetical protein
MALISMCLGNTLHINVHVFSVPYVINVKLPPTGTLTLMAKQTMTLMGSKSLTLMSLVRALQHRGGRGGHCGTRTVAHCRTRAAPTSSVACHWPCKTGPAPWGPIPVPCYAYPASALHALLQCHQRPNGATSLTLMSC